MSSRYIVRITLCVALMVASVAQLRAGGKSSAPPSKLKAIRTAAPGVKWDSAAIAGDFDCDRKTDHAFIGRAEGKVYVGVVFASRKPQIMQFGVDPQRQAAICGEPADIAAESLDYDPFGGLDETSGFRRSRHCSGLRLSGGECDPIHIYWDHKLKQLEWWRL